MSNIHEFTKAVRNHARSNVISVKEKFLELHSDEIQNEWALDVLISFMSDFATQPMITGGLSLEQIREENVQSKLESAQKYVNLFYKIPRVKGHFMATHQFTYLGTTQAVQPHIGFQEGLKAGARAMSFVEERISLEATCLMAYANELPGVSLNDPERLIEEYKFDIEPYGSPELVEKTLYSFMENMEHLMYNAHVGSLALRAMSQSNAWFDRGLKFAIEKVITGYVIPNRERKGDSIAKGTIDLESLPDDIEVFDAKLFPLLYTFEREYASQRCTRVYGSGTIGTPEVPRVLKKLRK